MTHTDEDMLALADRLDEGRSHCGHCGAEAVEQNSRGQYICVACLRENLVRVAHSLRYEAAAALRAIVAERQKPQAVKVKPRIFMLPDGRAGVCVGGRYDGWMMYRHPDGQWVTDHKMPVSDPSESLPAILAALDVSETPESDRQTDLLSASERQAIRDKALDDAAQAASNRAAYWWDEATAADDTGRKKLSLIYEAKALACTELAAAIRAMKGTKG